MVFNGCGCFLSGQFASRQQEQERGQECPDDVAWTKNSLEWGMSNAGEFLESWACSLERGVMPLQSSYFLQGTDLGSLESSGILGHLQIGKSRKLQLDEGCSILGHRASSWRLSERWHICCLVGVSLLPRMLHLYVRRQSKHYRCLKSLACSPIQRKYKEY